MMLDMVPTERERPVRHRLLFIAVCLLPFSYVPFEVTRTSVPVSYVTFVVVVVVGLAYARRTGSASIVEYVAIALAGWMAFVLIVSGPLGGDYAPAFGQALRELSTIAAGILLFRLARVEELRRTILNAIRVVFVGLLLMEAYQLAVGLPHLVALGYEWPTFNYNTEGGTYRPFGPFYSPTVFAPYLGMVGAVVTFTARGKWSVISGLLLIGGLAASDTRAAWIGLLVVGIILISKMPSERRAPLLFPLALSPIAAFVAVMVFPDVFRELWDRGATVFDLQYGSNDIRLNLWGGVLQAIGERPIDGYGSLSFVQSMTPYVGNLPNFTHAHSTPLMMLYTYGIVGTVLYLTLLLSIARKLWISADSAHMLAIASLGGVSLYFVASLFDSTWGSFSMIATVFLIAGLGTQAYRVPSGQSVVEQAKPDPIEDHGSSRSSLRVQREQR